MPIYVYKHPDEDIYEEVFHGMNDPHVFSKDGVEWNRVFLAPNATIAGDIDPFNKNAYIDKTANMKGTVGEALDYSAELSAKRAEKTGGEDPVKRKFFEQYSKERKGAKHPLDKPKSINKNGFKIDLD